MAGKPEVIELSDEDISALEVLKKPGKGKEIIIDLSSDDQSSAECGSDVVSDNGISKTKNMTANVNLKEKAKSGGSSSCFVDKSEVKKGYIKSKPRPPDRKDCKQKSKDDKEMMQDMSKSSSSSESDVVSDNGISKTKNMTANVNLKEKAKSGGSSSCFVDKSEVKKGYIKSKPRPPDRKDCKQKSKDVKEMMQDMSKSSSSSESDVVSDNGISKTKNMTANVNLKEKAKSGGSSSCFVDKSEVKKGYIKSKPRPPDRKDCKQKSKDDKEMMQDMSKSSSSSESAVVSDNGISKTKNMTANVNLKEKAKSGGSSSCFVDKSEVKKGYIKSKPRPPDRKDCKQKSKDDKEMMQDMSKSSSSSESDVVSGNGISKTKNMTANVNLKEKAKSGGSSSCFVDKSEVKKGYIKSKPRPPDRKDCKQKSKDDKEMMQDMSKSSSSSEVRTLMTANVNLKEKAKSGGSSSCFVDKSEVKKGYIKSKPRPPDRKDCKQKSKDDKEMMQDMSKSSSESDVVTDNGISKTKNMTANVNLEEKGKSGGSSSCYVDKSEVKKGYIKSKPRSPDRKDCKQKSKDDKGMMQDVSKTSSSSESISSHTKKSKNNGKKELTEKSKKSTKDVPGKSSKKEYNLSYQSAVKSQRRGRSKTKKRLRDSSESSSSWSGRELPVRKSRDQIKKTGSRNEMQKGRAVQGVYKSNRNETTPRTASKDFHKEYSRSKKRTRDSSYSSSTSGSSDEVSPDRKSKHLVHKRPAVKEYPNKKVTKEVAKTKEKQISGSLERERKCRSKEQEESSDSSDSKSKVKAHRDRKSKFADWKMGVDKEESKKKKMKSIVTAKGHIMSECRVSIDRKKYESFSEHEEIKKRASLDSEKPLEGLFRNAVSPGRKISDFSKQDSSENEKPSGKSIQSSGKSKESSDAISNILENEKEDIQREKIALSQGSSSGPLKGISEQLDRGIATVRDLSLAVQRDRLTARELQTSLDTVSSILKEFGPRDENDSLNLERNSPSRSCESPPKTTAKAETDVGIAQKKGSSSESSESGSDSSASSVIKQSKELNGIRNAGNAKFGMKRPSKALATLKSLVSQISRRKKKKQGTSESSSSSSSSNSSDSSSSSSGSSSNSSGKGSSKSSISKTRSSSSSSSSSPARQPKRITKSKEHAKKRSRSPRVKRRQRSQTPRPKKVHVGHLTRNINKDHLKEIFGLYGNIKHIDLPMDRGIGYNPRGFAYVEFDNADSAEKAVRHMNGAVIDGQKVTVATVLLYKPRPLPVRRISPMRRPFINWRYTPPFRNRGGGPLSSGGGGPRDRRRRMHSPFWRRSPRRRTRSRSPIRRRRMWRTSRSSSR